MAHDDHSTCFEELLQLLSEHGFDGMAEAIEILMNEAMKLQRADALGAMPYQRSESRRGYANGFKPKTVNSRLGRLNLKVPQTRDVEFYPSALPERSDFQGHVDLPISWVAARFVGSSRHTTSLCVY